MYVGTIVFWFGFRPNLLHSVRPSIPRCSHTHNGRRSLYKSQSSDTGNSSTCRWSYDLRKKDNTPFITCINYLLINWYVNHSGYLIHWQVFLLYVETILDECTFAFSRLGCSGWFEVLYNFGILYKSFFFKCFAYYGINALK